MSTQCCVASCIAAATSGGIGAPLNRVAVPFALRMPGRKSDRKGAQSHQIDRRLSTLAPATNLTTATPILPQQRKSAGCFSYPLERAAHGVIGVVVANMVRAIRTISVERGHDPPRLHPGRLRVAGPLHARDVAAALGIRAVLVPVVPGIVCAQGLVDRTRLRPGVEIAGPAIVEQLDATAVVHPGDLARVDGHANLDITLGGEWRT